MNPCELQRASCKHHTHPKYYAAEQARSGWVRSIFSRTAGDYEGFCHGPWYRILVSTPCAEGERSASLDETVVDVGVR